MDRPQRAYIIIDSPGCELKVVRQVAPAPQENGKLFTEMVNRLARDYVRLGVVVVLAEAQYSIEARNNPYIVREFDPCLESPTDAED